MSAFTLHKNTRLVGSFSELTTNRSEQDISTIKKHIGRPPIQSLNEYIQRENETFTDASVSFDDRTKSSADSNRSKDHSSVDLLHRYGRNSRCSSSESIRSHSRNHKNSVKTGSEYITKGCSGSSTTFVPSNDENVCAPVLSTSQLQSAVSVVYTPSKESSDAYTSSRWNLAKDVWPKVTDYSTQLVYKDTIPILNAAPTITTQDQLPGTNSETSVFERQRSTNLQHEIVHAYVNPKGVQEKLAGILPIGLRDLELLGDHVNALTSKLRIGCNNPQLNLVIDDVSNNVDASQEHSVRETIQSQLPSCLIGSSLVSVGQPLPNTLKTCNESASCQSEESYDHGSHGVNINSITTAGISVKQATSMIEYTDYIRQPDDIMLNLPNNVSAMTHLQYSIRSYSHVSKNLLKKWKHYLLVEGSQQIMICWFWYIFLQQWRPDQTDNMNHLVRHASTLYVKLFLRYKGDDKDEFFQELPEFYSQAIYTAYRECFPLSHKHFDASFQIKLCDSMHRLMSGITPYNPSCTTWSHDVLSSKVVEGKKELEDNPSQYCIWKKAPAPTIDWFKPKTEVLDVVSTGLKLPQSCCMGPYIQSKHLPTYRQIITDSVKQSKRNFKLYKHSQDEAMRERSRVAQEMSAQLLEEQRRARQILSRPQEVKSAVDQILEVHTTRDMTKRSSRSRPPTQNTSSKNYYH
ncbi:hypothetical protein MT418_002070 [Batrachochytrium dendrobatidis]